MKLPGGCSAARRYHRGKWSMVKILSLSFRVRNFLPEENGESTFAQGSSARGAAFCKSRGPAAPPPGSPTLWGQRGRRAAASRPPGAAVAQAEARGAAIAPTPAPRTGKGRSRPCGWTARGLPRLLALATALSTGNTSSSSSTSPLDAAWAAVCESTGQGRGAKRDARYWAPSDARTKEPEEAGASEDKSMGSGAWPARQLRRALEKIGSLPSLESSPSWLTNPLCFQALLSMNVLS